MASRSKLPSLEELTSEAKRRKTVLSDFKDSYSSISTINLCEFQSRKLDKLSENAKVCWLIAKFGLSSIAKLCVALKLVPQSLTAKQRVQALADCCGLPEKDVIALEEFITEQCPGTLSDFSPEPQEVPFILAPPVGQCYDCDSNLVSNHTTQVKCYTCDGVKAVTKITLRCKKCSITYNYAHFGNKGEFGFRYYPVARPYVEVSDTVYFHRAVLEFQCSLANHSWVSFQGFAESYNDSFQLPRELELTPRIVGEAFYTGELENELRRIGKVDYRFRMDSDREKCMEVVEEVRRVSLYPHGDEDCTAECKKRGCGQLWVTDGIWKTVFPHCMFRVEHSVSEIPNLNLPDVCAAAPERGKAFCEEHCKLLEEQAPEVPTRLKDFLVYCGRSPTDVDDEELSPVDVDKVDQVVDKLQVTGNTVGQSAANSQGIHTLIKDHPSLLDTAIDSHPCEPMCRKDTGQSKRLRKWSRGHQFVVRGGGHIDTWQPLFKSESPSQVFFIVLQWLCSLVNLAGKVPKVILAYDNMCNLARMKVAQQPLPFPSPLDRLWLNVEKIIDVFHFRNHVSKTCHTKFNPAKMKADNPHFNTQVGEQTFVWVSRFKHILCSMNKIHHLFYLHRMVLRRNRYTSKCYKHGKKPILPKKTISDASH